MQVLTKSLSSANPESLESLISELKVYNQISLQNQFSFYKAVVENKLQSFQKSCSKLNFNEEIKKICDSLVVPIQPFNKFNYRWGN